MGTENELLTLFALTILESTLNYGHCMPFLLFFLGRVLALEIKGQNTKEESSTLKSVALRLKKQTLFL